MYDDPTVVHVGDWKFGEGIRIEEHIRDVAALPRRLTSTDLQIVLRERYEQSHGIYDHNASTDPLALVLMHWEEDAITSSTLRARMETFMDNRVGERFRLSFTEFLELPSYVCDLMIEVCTKRKDDVPSEALEQALKNMGKN